MPGWFVVAMTLVGIGFVFIIWAQLRFASYSFALHYLQGERVQVQIPLKQLGVHKLGDHIDAKVKITNHGDKSVTIVGAVADCSCVATSGLPKDIAPGETVHLQVHASFGPKIGDWRQQITYLTNNFQQPELNLELLGRVESL